ncbi:MAG: bis(5'-nucleosyl)-tetraphosphatase (symmetrical) YqeK [Erysipelotrichaceae bacterium]|nr:bis(5'-nucleosyl)-tetraphosphatase (symmetrical) YqeK [Erysipelotrichaceae bacterium]
MIILKDRFDPVLKEHLAIIKQYHKIGFYLEDDGILDKASRRYLLQVALKPYHHAVIVDKITADDIVITQDNAATYALIQQGQLHLLAKNTRKIILAKGWYLSTILEAHNHGKRLTHVRSMTNLALTLAKWHHVDQNKVKICAMMHDICKQLAYDKQKQLMEKYFPAYLSQDPALYHQYLGAWFLRHYLGIYDQKMYDAIKYHTTGEATSKLAMIIFIADKLDPSRGYDISKQLQVVKKDLRAGFALVKAQQIAYITKVEGKEIGTIGNRL